MKAETTRRPLLPGMGQDVAHEVDAAALPGGGEDLGDGGLDALVGIGDDELDAAQAAPRQLAQEGGPEGLGFGGADIHAQHLAPAVGIDADRDDDRDRHDAAGPANLQVGGVDPQIRPITLDRAVEEGLDPLIDVLAQPTDLALGDAAHAHGLDQFVDRARRDALDVDPMGQTG